jgi:hypothetical protein
MLIDCLATLLGSIVAAPGTREGRNPGHRFFSSGSTRYPFNAPRPGISSFSGPSLPALPGSTSILPIGLTYSNYTRLAPVTGYSQDRIKLRH